MRENVMRRHAVFKEWQKGEKEIYEREGGKYTEQRERVEERDNKRYEG